MENFLKECDWEQLRYLNREFYELQQAMYHTTSCGPSEVKPTKMCYSDIVLHLPVLEYYASLCDSVVEFGVRDAYSTVALISGCKGTIDSYDIEESRTVKQMLDMNLPCKMWRFHKESTIDSKTVVPECDLMFFDTVHTYEHLSQELKLHALKARKYLAFHDTWTCRDTDRTGENPLATGIGKAIGDYLDLVGNREHVHYHKVFETNWSNGLLILKRNTGLCND